MIHALGPSFLSTLRRLCSAQLWEATSAGNSAGCQVTFKTVWSRAARSRQDRGRLYGFSQVQGVLSLEKGWCLSTTVKGALGKHKTPPFRVSPFLNVPPRSSLIELLFSLLLFLADILYCIQMHIWKRLPQAKSNFIVALRLPTPTEEILHTQPTNPHSLTHMSQGGKLDLRG